MPKAKVIEPLEHDGERYMPDDEFDGPADVVKHLQSTGVLESPPAKGKGKAKGDEE